MAANDEGSPGKVTWTIRFDEEGDEADQWDELLYSLRREAGRRTLNKADIFRALIKLASDQEGPVRSSLVDALSQGNS